MEKETTRQQKVARVVQRELSEIFLKLGTSFFGGKMVSVTTVRMSPDLGIAKVYISLFPKSDDDIDRVKEHEWQVKNELAKRMRNQLKKMPELKFFEDDSLDYYDNIDNILNP